MYIILLFVFYITGLHETWTASRQSSDFWLSEEKLASDGRHLFRCLTHNPVVIFDVEFDIIVRFMIWNRSEALACKFALQSRRGWRVFIMRKLKCFWWVQVPHTHAHMFTHILHDQTLVFHFTELTHACSRPVVDFLAFKEK